VQVFKEPRIPMPFPLRLATEVPALVGRLLLPAN